MSALEQAAAQPAQPQPRPLEEPRPATILVVDDHEDNVELVCQTLEDYACETLRAHDGHAAIDLAIRERPDLVILDIMMPGLDGIATCRLLMADARTRDIPVIFLSARGEAADLREGLEAGAHDYVRKPFHADELVARVQSALRFKRKQDELVAARRELEAKNTELARLAVMDGLTELYNHTHLLKQLEGEFLRASRYGKRLSFLMMDIDYFKRVNDRFGHRTGDRMLREMAAIFRAQLRSIDVVGRYGGEEFAVILPETDHEGALAIAERLRQAVETHPFELGEEGEPLRVTISIGVATFPGPRVKRAEDLVETADRRLYQAKAGGRNLVQG
jgi:two-component system cell cycle response regulator